MKKSAIKVMTLLAASLGGAAFAFVIQVILARHLEPSQYGLFAAILAVVTLVSALSSLGVPGFILRVFGAEGSGGGRWLKPAYQIVFLGMVICLLVLLVWGIVGSHEREALILMALFVPIVISQPFVELVTVKLQLEGRFYRLALWQLIPNFSRLVGLAALLVIMPSIASVTSFGSVYTTVAVLITVLGFLTIRQFPEKSEHLISEGSHQVFVDGATTSSTVIRYSMPFALSGLFYIVYFQSDVILLNYLSSSESAGFYNVAFTVMVAVYLLPNTLYQKFLLPSLYRWVHHDPDRLSVVYRRGSLIMGTMGTLIMLCLFVFIPVVIPWLFGDAYRETISILNILLLCIPLRFISSTIASVLASEMNIKRKAAAMGYTALANIILNIALIPQWHVYGAAIATFISELLLLLLFYRCAQKHVFQTPQQVTV